MAGISAQTGTLDYVRVWGLKGYKWPVSLMDISMGSRKTHMKILDMETALSSNAGKAINEIKSQMKDIKLALDMKAEQIVEAIQSETAEKQERIEAIKRGLNTIQDDSRFLLGEGGNSEKFLKILRHNVTGKARVLMWSDGTYSVQANHYITADMTLVADRIGGEDALVWSGIDAADGSRKILRHNVTGKARVLMWSDGTYSVQANHYITADMTLVADRIGGEDALVWSGIDAADGSRKVSSAEAFYLFERY
uniref:RanBD1 domain-containing protein n=1 Tax=Branchiostoma floridae TaxID=7739 RepID=C3Y3B5_BRAFL|eukprot:XP_002609172.1 hypothetical protein BRAFLDRAFT_92537 [Branchiostoma floridae]